MAIDLRRKEVRGEILRIKILGVFCWEGRRINLGKWRQGMGAADGIRRSSSFAKGS